MLKKPVEAALFDMDGLLLDTEAIYVEAMQEAARTLGLRELPLDFGHSAACVPGPERNRFTLKSIGALIFGGGSRSTPRSPRKLFVPPLARTG